MRLGRIFGSIMPAVALAMAGGLSACGDVNVQFGDSEGVPLADLDTSGDSPETVALAAPDNVVITSGEEFAITVEGTDTATERMRFVLDDGTLGISREDGDWDDSDLATITVIMPPPNSIVMVGSGTVTADAMSSEPEIVIAGSGRVRASGLDADSLEVTITGSGTAELAGSADRLDLNLLGSGSASMAELQAGGADVNIAGSGSATFASDGDVEANIVGSGTVRVLGSATCTVNAVGSGTLTCGPADDASPAEEGAEEAAEPEEV